MKFCQAQSIKGATAIMVKPKPTIPKANSKALNTDMLETLNVATNVGCIINPGVTSMCANVTPAKKVS